MSILIVGDTIEQRIFLKNTLEKEGFTDIKLAETAREASEYLGITNPFHASTVDLILIGNMMPDMSGIEACRLIKATEHLHDIPIIMTSDKSDLKKLKLAFAVGAMDFIVKPLHETELLARVRSSLRLKYEMDTRKARERELMEMTRQLKESKKKIEKASEKIMESLRYAQMIQYSLLPNPAEVKAYLPESFSIWMPRDIVGGDIFYMDFFRDGFVVAVIDCTGHGIPGAFLTMIASAALRRIIRDEGVRMPAQALKRLNVIVKTTLQQDMEYAISDSGMDAAICFVRNRKNILLFAGARLPLVYIHNGKIHLIKGDRQSIGYKQSKRTDINFNFTEHSVNIEKEMRFYMATDGFEDQIGEAQNIRIKASRFGRTRFRTLIREVSGFPFEQQKEMLLEAFNVHKGREERQDDVTVVGFQI